ncbi:MAG TPA: DUF2269 family protein [Trebonia sp.]
MTGFLLAVHVLGAILAVGPVAVAASMLPAAARAAIAAPGDPSKRAVVRVLARITRVYSVIGIIVPVFGFATAGAMDMMGSTWLIASVILTAVAAGILTGLILPGQRRALTALDGAVTVPGAGTEELVDARFTRRLTMQAGIFNLLWAAVVVLMIYRPGSTTGAGL